MSMMAASCPAEARMVVEREILRSKAMVVRSGIIPFPCANGRLVVLCAEMSDGSDIQCLCLLDIPVAVHGDYYDEDAIARQFLHPNETRH